MANIASLPARPVRLSQKLRAAIGFMVHEGATQLAAAAKAGMSRQGLGKALKKAAVRDYKTETQRAFVAEVEGSRALYRARAFEAAWNLLQNSQSEAIKARMIEFLACDGRVSPVAVHIDARSGGGYEYARPGQRIVEIQNGEKSVVEGSQV